MASSTFANWPENAEWPSEAPRPSTTDGGDSPEHTQEVAQ